MIRFAHDAEFDESDHPRGQPRNAGQFVESSGSSSESYTGQHEAPDKDSGAPVWNTKGIYPDDFYGSNGFKYYADFGDPMDSQSYFAIVDLQHHPNKQVKIFRAIPADLTAKDINKGDWVTLSRDYAKLHGEGALNGKYKIISKTVHARDLFTNGDSVHELGYDPQPMVPYSQVAAKMTPAEAKAKLNRLDPAKTRHEVIKALTERSGQAQDSIVTDPRSRFIADEDEVEAIFGEALEGMLADDDEAPEDIFKEREPSIFSPRDEDDIFKERDLDIFAPRDDDIFEPAEDEFVESQHPRGQPENAGQFAKSGGGAKSTAREVLTHWHGVWPDVKAVEAAFRTYEEIEKNMDGRELLTPEELRAAKWYSRSGAWETTMDVNHMKPDLLSKIVGPLWFASDVNRKRYIKEMDKAVAKESLPQPVKVYRGMTLQSFKGEPSDLVGAVIGNKSFTSTSLNPYMARKFVSGGDNAKGFLLEIGLPKGQHALHVGSVPGNFDASELELVLPRNMRFKVVGVNEGKPPVLIVKLLKPK